MRPVTVIFIINFKTTSHLRVPLIAALRVPMHNFVPSIFVNQMSCEAFVFLETMIPLTPSNRRSFCLYALKSSQYLLYLYLLKPISLFLSKGIQIYTSMKVHIHETRLMDFFLFVSICVYSHLSIYIFKTAPQV